VCALVSLRKVSFIDVSDATHVQTCEKERERKLSYFILVFIVYRPRQSKPLKGISFKIR